MVNSRRKRLEREIDRDARVTTSGYVHEVMSLTVGRLQYIGLANQCPDPIALFDEVEEITRKFRNFHRRLNDGRINRRGERDRHAPPAAELPAAARPFAYHGAYLGAFSSVEDFAHACLDPSRPDQWAAYVDLTQAGIDLHLSGRYWTVDADGVTHAFAVDGSGAGGPGDGLTAPEADAPRRAELRLGPGETADSGFTASGFTAADFTAADSTAADSTAADSTAADSTAADSTAASSTAAFAAALAAVSLGRAGSSRRRRPKLRDQPALPRHEPGLARAALARAGCDERTIAALMAWYVAGYDAPGAHVWYFLRRSGLPGRVLERANLQGLAKDWCDMGVLAWARDPEGGVQVFAFGDPLASHR